MPVIRGEGRLQRSRPAKPLKPGRDLRVIQVRMIAAARADDLKHVGVAAFEPAIQDVDRLTPYVRRAAVAGLPGGRRHGGTAGRGAQPRVTAAVRTGIRSGTGHGAWATSSVH